MMVYERNLICKSSKLCTALVNKLVIFSDNPEVILFLFCFVLFFRYSHTAHVVNDNLVLIGGVTPNSSHPPGVVVLHLTSLTWKSYTLPVGLTLPRSIFSNSPIFWKTSHAVKLEGLGNIAILKWSIFRKKNIIHF